MSQDEDKTVVFSDISNASDVEEQNNSQNFDAPKAVLLCGDSSQVEGNPEELKLELSGNNEIIIGRGDDCDFIISSRKLSRKHARIYAGEGRWGVEDLNSTNGIFVNGNKVTSAWLRHGDELKFGPIPFKFSLERPELSSSSNTSSAADSSEEEDETEKTMMFGMGKSSEVFLQAAREAKEEEQEENQEKNSEDWGGCAVPGCNKDEEGKEECHCNTKKFSIIGAVATVILIIALAVPGYLKNKRINESLSKANKVISSVLEETRWHSNVQLYNVDYEENLIKLSELYAKMEPLLEQNKGNTKVINTIAKIAFMEFEREFSALLSKRNIAEARDVASRMQARAKAIEKSLPEGATQKEAYDAFAVINLAELAELVVDFRTFALRYPRVSETTTNKPSEEEMNPLNVKKQNFVRYRRTYNRPMSVTFIVFKNIVDDVDQRDIALFNEWKSYYRSLKRDSSIEGIRLY